VGKAVNLKKRVASHFSGHTITLQRQHFLRDIYSISFEVCATELMALLLECTEIKKLWPVHNKALKRFDAKFGLYEYEARSGYRYLAVGKLGKHQASIEVFNSLHDGITLLRTLAAQFDIDHRFCKYCIPGEEEAPVQKDVTNLPDLSAHNMRVQSAIDFVAHSRPSFAIIDKGRYADERSCIWVENGHFYGMGYIPTHVGLIETSELKEHVIRYKSNHYIMQLLHSYAGKYPGKVIFREELVRAG